MTSATLSAQWISALTQPVPQTWTSNAWMSTATATSSSKTSHKRKSREECRTSRTPLPNSTVSWTKEVRSSFSQSNQPCKTNWLLSSKSTRTSLTWCKITQSMTLDATPPVWLIAPTNSSSPSERSHCVCQTAHVISRSWTSQVDHTTTQHWLHTASTTCRHGHSSSFINDELKLNNLLRLNTYAINIMSLKHRFLIFTYVSFFLHDLFHHSVPFFFSHRMSECT